MFEAYVKEREGAVLIKHEHGFGLYKDVTVDTGYLQDVFVQPEYRLQGVAKQILQQTLDLAKKSNKKALLSSTDTTANGATESALAILHCGFRILKLDGNVIWYIMEIQ